jgi:hypothetical protein
MRIAVSARSREQAAKYHGGEISRQTLIQAAGNWAGAPYEKMAAKRVGHHVSQSSSLQSMGLRMVQPSKPDIPAAPTSAVLQLKLE